MGPYCHSNYIRVTEDGTYDSAGHESAAETGETRTLKVEIDTTDKKIHSGDARHARGIHLGHAFRSAAR